MQTQQSKKRKTLLPCKSALLKDAEYWKWQALTMKGERQPWLMIPGLVVYLNTDDLSDIECRLDVLRLALKQLSRRGVIFQIDNMHAGVMEENERYRSALEHIAGNESDVNREKADGIAIEALFQPNVPSQPRGE